MEKTIIELYKDQYTEGTGPTFRNWAILNGFNYNTALNVANYGWLMIKGDQSTKIAKAISKHLRHKTLEETFGNWP